MLQYCAGHSVVKSKWKQRVCLCSKQDNAQEEVLTTVSAVLQMLINVWKCNKGPAKSTMGTELKISLEEFTRCVLDLALNPAWITAPALRQRQMEVIVALLENISWSSSGIECTCTGIMTACLRLLEIPQTQEEEICNVLVLVSQVLQQTGVLPHTHTPIPSVTPFSRRKRREEHWEHFPRLVALAFSVVLAKVDDSSVKVRLAAIETLGDFIPHVQPDVSMAEELITDRNQISTVVDSERYADRSSTLRAR